MKKVLCWLLTVAMMLSMVGAAFADVVIVSIAPAEAAAEEAAAEETAEAPAEEEAPAVTATVIDFEDGLYGFVGVETVVGNADSSELSVVEFNGSKALKVTVVKNGKVPYIAFNLEGLLGDNLAKVATIVADIGLDLGADGKFYAASGNFVTYVGEEANKVSTPWSVYMAKKNPKAVTVAVPGQFVADCGNYLVITKEVDNYASKSGDVPVAMYIDNLMFLDAEGNALPVDTTAEYVAAASAGPDLSNLFAVTGAVEFPGFSTSGGAWSQNGFEMPQEIIDALVPGTVVEIDYKSADGAIWLVMPWAEAGWMRVGGCGNGTDLVNNSHTVAQIPYELIAQFCGEDKATWGAMMQCEGSSDWEVYALRVGKANPVITVSNAVEFPGFSTSGGAWSQNGFEMPQEIIDALVPGSVIEIDFASDNGDLWLVMPWAEAGWMRVGGCGNGEDVVIGGKAYITYELIEQFCGADKATWGAMMQCEASGNWEVYSLKVGTYGEVPALTNFVEFPGFSTNGGAWSQNGFEMPQEIVDALVPGTAVVVDFASDNGDLWLVMPWAEAGWMRVGGCGNGQDIVVDGRAIITYELIEQFCGADKATWGAMMQCEASGNWEVYALSVATIVK